MFDTNVKRSLILRTPTYCMNRIIILGLSVSIVQDFFLSRYFITNVLRKDLFHFIREYLLRIYLKINISVYLIRIIEQLSRERFLKYFSHLDDTGRFLN